MSDLKPNIKPNLKQRRLKLSNKKLRPSIKKDAINPSAYNQMKLPWACEDCVYFNADRNSVQPTTDQTHRCVLGYLTWPHLRRHQQQSYELSGKVALCRFLEID